MESNFKELREYYLEWRDFDEYLVLQKQTDSLRVKGEVDRKTIAIKLSKRGNDVYGRRLWKRLKFLYDLEDTVLFDPHGNVKTTNVLLVTLTYDTKHSGIQDAWETIGDDFNKYMRNLRKKFGCIAYLRCWESSQKAYPHIHVLMMFQDSTFRVTRIHGKYRIDEKEEFEKSYHSFVDIQAIREFKKGIRYVTKYLTKTKKRKSDSELNSHLMLVIQKTLLCHKWRLPQTDSDQNKIWYSSSDWPSRSGDHSKG